MDDFDDIFGEAPEGQAVEGQVGDVPEDDDIDALFGLSSPSANADAVREAMEATAMAEGHGTGRAQRLP